MTPEELQSLKYAQIGIGSNFAAEGWYLVKDGKVYVYSIDAPEMPDQAHHLAETTLEEGDDPYRTAQLLLRDHSGKRQTAFNRPLHYPKSFCPH